MSNEEKEYSNGDIAIVWKQEKCIHSANCVRTLPGVFKPHERPWISVNNADTPHLIEAIDKCPSGALSYKKIEADGQFEEKISAAVDQSTHMNILADGPILVKGSFQITDSSGNTIETKDNVALCRCGASANKPFCDGSHKGVGFKG